MSTVKFAKRIITGMDLTKFCTTRKRRDARDVQHGLGHDRSADQERDADHVMTGSHLQRGVMRLGAGGADTKPDRIGGEGFEPGLRIGKRRFDPFDGRPGGRRPARPAPLLSIRMTEGRRVSCSHYVEVQVPVPTWRSRIHNIGRRPRQARADPATGMLAWCAGTVSCRA